MKCLKKERKREQRKENKKQNTKIYSSKLQCKKTGAQQEKRTAQNGDIFSPKPATANSTMMKWME